MKTVSIIIPVYNNENYIEKCVRSIMNQTFQKLQIIIINDGSTDKSKDILEKLALEDKRILLIHQSNAGTAAARNTGLSVATGEYLAFVDGDDYINDDYIEKLYNCAEEQQAQMVICGITFVDHNMKVLRTLIPGEYKRYEKEEWTFKISAVCSHFYCRELWEKYNILFYPGERGEDMPISLFFSAVCDKIVTLAEAGYFYVQHSESAMSKFRGLINYELPYHALEEVLMKVEKIGVVNSQDFYELFVLRILSTCFFDLGRGASRDKMKELCDYIVYVLHRYFPKYYRNKLAGLFSTIEVPFSQKVAVWLLSFLVRTKLLYPISRLLSH